MPADFVRTLTYPLNLTRIESHLFTLVTLRDDLNLPTIN